LKRPHRQQARAAVYSDRDQLETLRDAISVYLDPPDGRTPDRNFSRLAPIAGGCDDIPAEYHPTEEDWEEYHRMFDQIESEPPARNPLGLGSRDFAERLAYGHLG
jgi:hypothetical protein